MIDFAVALTPYEQGWVATMIFDAAAERDTTQAARLIEARIETLMQRRLEPMVTLMVEWEREALAETECPDGFCGTCTQGNLAHLLRFAMEDGNA